MDKPNMKTLRGGAFALLAMAATAMFTTPARAADSEAWTAYQSFVTKCQSATDMKQLLPWLPEWRHERHEVSDEAGRNETLKQICKNARDLEGISFVSEKIKGANTVLQLKATWNDFPMKAKVTMVREDDGLKVDETFWATGK